MSGYQLRKLSLAPDALTLFPCLKQLAGSFLLHSGNNFSNQRFDIFSALPSATCLLPASASVIELREAIASMTDRLVQHSVASAPYPLPGWYGLMSYDAAGETETKRGPATPRLATGFYPVIFMIDRQMAEVSCVLLDGHEALADQLTDALLQPSPIAHKFQLREPFRANMTAEQYAARFQQVQAYLHAGDCYQVNLAQRFSAPFEGDPWAAFVALSNALPAPMGCYFGTDDFHCLSVSPERFLAINQGVVTTHPIKGTRPRHDDPKQDQKNANALQTSEKDRAENLMIVDLLRNDLGISCVPGSIRVTRLFGIESFANVHHMVSDIEGCLREDQHPLLALLMAFPGGSITGAPKKRAMEIIAELEPDARSFYCGSAFYCDVSGRLDSNILIRSLVCSGGNIHCWGGGGIVVDSTAEAEYQETLDKVGGILRTLETLSGLSNK